MIMRSALSVLFMGLAIFSTQTCCLSKTQQMTVHASSLQVVFSLPINPSTGYQWVLETYDKSVLNFQNKGYKVSSQAMGAPGNMIWVFKLSHQSTLKKSTEIILKYKRPWQTDAIKVMKVKVIL
jgi:inhibitor of cysteine peptidase